MRQQLILGLSQVVGCHDGKFHLIPTSLVESLDQLSAQDFYTKPLDRHHTPVASTDYGVAALAIPLLDGD